MTLASCVLQHQICEAQCMCFSENFEGAIISEQPSDILVEVRGGPSEIPRGQVVW